MQASSDIAGTIIPFAKTIGPTYMAREGEGCHEPFICIKIHGRWKWQRLETLSSARWSEWSSEISKTINTLGQNAVVADKQMSIEITGSTATSADSINAIWMPIDSPHEDFPNEFNVYKSHDGNRYLYCTIKLDNGVRKYQWWIGTKPNMERRKPWGFMKQHTPTTSPFPPWQINQWDDWSNDVAGGSWHAPNTSIQVSVMDKEYILSKEKKKLDAEFDNFKKELEANVKSTLQACDTIREQHSKRVDDYRNMSRVLFNNLSKEERVKLADTSTFRTLFKKEDLCSCCLASKKTTKCIHSDCTGACETCRGDNEDAICCACGKEQILECPICQTSYQPSFMNIFKCKHAVCWRCNCKAYEAKRPLKKCPMCRAEL